MLAGHIDEIGVQITHIEENGLLRFTGVGGWDSQVLVGQLFFFQAEDGIRSHCVTGLQTCALPIYRSDGLHGLRRRLAKTMRPSPRMALFERLIGRASCRKECRSRWATYQ